MTLARIETRVRQDHLDVFGAFHTTPTDNLANMATVILLGPLEPAFWPHFTQSHEYLDAKADPLDRWSTRVIEQAAHDLGGEARFPFDAPVQPFISWAIRSGRAWQSPVQLLVHDTAGLWVSYRGAILLPDRLDLPTQRQSPCDTCPDTPCTTACPSQALTDAGYTLPVCHSYLDTKDGQSCMSQGCAVRRSCPVSKNYPRMDAQSAFHMDKFHP